MIKFTVDWLIDFFVVMIFVILSLCITGVAFLFYPFKKIKNFLAKKTIQLMDTADYFLDYSQEYRND